MSNYCHTVLDYVCRTIGTSYFFVGLLTCQTSDISDYYHTTSHMSVPLPGMVYHKLSAILTLRHHLDRLWKPISFNTVLTFYSCFSDVFSSVRNSYYVLICACLCERACVCVRTWCVCLCARARACVDWFHRWMILLRALSAVVDSSVAA